ncbi:hypothetical protein OIU76_016319 [Salix suchowensis]|uniref:NAC domain-containing protein n=1 Tax=Salix suchowensis TaxID=1278906 RepID=A0ABQ9AW88_9ROSI|nr:hypothetical protein OIU77_004442 [Salix suchowensis]KAJ6379647.1 hypothetical protein OIU76_016319 [Salix suchowensis]
MAASTGGVPPGFRFHPTDEELLHYYLKKKVSFQKFDMEVVREVDLNKMEPWELQETCKIGSTPQNEWYFFSHRDRKYPTGSRTNRATNAGFWKATGRDKCIRNSYKKIGMRKTLVFYRGRAPHGQKTDWIMHEFRLEDGTGDDAQGNSAEEDGWVVCRVFKKKNLFKVSNDGGAASMNSSDQQLHTSSSNQYSHYSSLRHHHNHNHNHGSIQQALEPNKPDQLALHYHHTETPHQYSLFPSQTLMPTDHKPLGYGYSALPSESKACETGLEVGAQMVSRRDDHLGMNEWDMIDRDIIVTSHLGNEDSSKAVRFQDANAPSVHPLVNQLSFRGEMDFWGYGK